MDRVSTSASQGAGPDRVAPKPKRTPQRISPIWWLQALRRRFTRKAPFGQPRLIYRAPDTAIVWRPGKSDQLVVIFQGIQARPLQPKRLEFKDIAWDQGRFHVLFVVDRCRSWYSRPGQQDRIVEQIRQFAAAQGISSIRAAGNSMGGYGAILFSDRLPISKVIAFVPQILMTEEVICHSHWSKNRGNITDEVVRDLTPILARTTSHVHIIYGEEDVDDPLHLAHLRREVPDATQVRIVIVPGQDHNVAAWLKAQGQLAGLVAALWVNDRQALETCSRALEKPLDLTLA